MIDLKQIGFLGCLLFCIAINAQQVKGVVTDEYNQPLEAVYIYNLNTKSHAHTSETGVFINDNNNDGDSLKIGLLGYKTKIHVLKRSDLDTTLAITLSEKVFQLNEMVIAETLDALNTIAQIDLNTNPVNSSQEVLRKVPGLIIGQHAGGGKAEQIFLRGFDIDHGTDVAISVDGMPVNMVSHAHGQGYSDLHFVIPETIGKINFGKGSYYAEQGDFNTAAYIDFETKNCLKESSVSMSLGRFNALRTLGMFNFLENNKRENAYLAVEYIENDGPFVSPQNFNRLNVFSKYVAFSPNNDKLALSVSHFQSRWDASGQIPQREVDNGNISRFGAIDDTEGGYTERSNINVAYSKHLSKNKKLKTNAFYSHYGFELYSNFTFFLEDPVNGDQIKQYENRNLFGLNTAISQNTTLWNNPLHVSYGLGFRYDATNNTELSKTKDRKTVIEHVQLGDINQTNIDAFIGVEGEFGKFKIAPALRLDYFKFLYHDKLANEYALASQTKMVLSPKLNVFYNANSNLQWYLKSGIGFHSNDTRVVVGNQRGEILPKSYGLDLGTIWKPGSKFILNTALWYLFLEQEFVYVGDAGIVEPSGETERFGIDLGLRYQYNDWLFFDSDITYTKARSIEEPKEANYIPLAPDFTISGGASIKNLKGFSGGFRYRYIDDRSANENNTIVAKGYFVTDFNANYSFKKLKLGVTIENLFNVAWNETQFATVSRLQNEPQPVEEIHFTPGTPFFIKGTITYKL
ncbi:TonB-dependent receptor [Snuella sedimenti]|uniref:TonB-dependent receptor plug domain-containing protein n=1 Tax=Snuella sedimenti TaxID=2798802 RepID=A0A8J7J2J2_9FLAO|nr:TonB-dependent receptor plug domain-containing protein [Snuella sedimenti]MBJ6368572.1 TonB-dependent receptor plug domain-containing protein [Snuella sedimenti]